MLLLIISIHGGLGLLTPYCAVSRGLTCCQVLFTAMVVSHILVHRLIVGVVLDHLSVGLFETRVKLVNMLLHYLRLVI